MCYNKTTIEIGASLMKNVNLIKWYIGLTYDFLFFLVVQVFFLNQVKHIEIADILLLESIFAILRLIIQVPLMKFAKIYGNVFCFRLAPIITFVSLLCYLWSPSFAFLIIASLLKAIGWGLKNISSSPLLYNELKSIGKEGEYGKHQGEAQSNFTLINILASIISGFLFEINPYIPIIICLVIHFITIIISFIVVPIQEKLELSIEKISMIKNIKMVITDNFFLTLFLFMMITWGLLGFLDTVNVDYLNSIGLSVGVCTIILSLAQITSYIFARFQYVTDRLFHGKAMYILVLCITVPFVLVGLFYVFDLPFIILCISAILAILMESLTGSQFRIYALDYINRYSDPSLSTEAVGVYYLFEALGRFIITFIAGIVLKCGNIGFSYIILVGLLIIPLFYLANRLTFFLKNK